MSTPAQQPQPPPVRITFAAWKNAPLSWSAYVLGRWMDRRGEPLMAWALERIGRD